MPKWITPEHEARIFSKCEVLSLSARYIQMLSAIHLLKHRPLSTRIRSVEFECYGVGRANCLQQKPMSSG